MKQLLIASVLILVAMSGMAAADQEEWAYGRSNTAMEGIEFAHWNFEEGSNCGVFKNQHPEIATFLDVPTSSLSPMGYGPNKPSYVCAGGSMCGTTRCYMRIYPYNNNQDWIYIVNGNCAFAPVTCCVEPDICWLGNCYPGMKAHIEFKPDTHYISFLACTGNNLYVRLYDRRGDILHYEKITKTIDRVGSEPSNWTRFEMHIPNVAIDSMILSGSLNDWHMDGLIAGGEPGYLPPKPVNYTYVARRAQELHGVDYLEYGLGHDYLMLDYMDPWQFTDGMMGEYWNPETKTFEDGEGISNAGLILWAYNYDSDELAGTSFVKRNTVAGMEKHDFKVDVEPSDTQPGDVCFMDRDGDSKGYADEVYMVIETTEYGMDLITSCPDDNTGVIYSKKSIVEGSPAFMGYKRLPGVIRGGSNPIPKGH